MGMDQHRLGSTNREAPVIGQGTWFDERDDSAAAIAALRRGIDLGMTHIDTAEMYGSGAIVGYSPFGRGHFPGPCTPGGRVLEEIAAAHHATARQIALRFLVRRPSLFTIPRATNPEHAAENAVAGNLELTKAELACTDEAFPRGSRPHVLPTL
jgi:diketogulonate reductase-like aldo/keto reductase